LRHSDVGRRGAVLLEAQGIARLSARAVEAVDTVGAGGHVMRSFRRGRRKRPFAGQLAAARDGGRVSDSHPQRNQTSFPTRAEARALSEKLL